MIARDVDERSFPLLDPPSVRKVQNEHIVPFLEDLLSATWKIVVRVGIYLD